MPENDLDFVTTWHDGLERINLIVTTLLVGFEGQKLTGWTWEREIDRVGDELWAELGRFHESVQGNKMGQILPADAKRLVAGSLRLLLEKVEGIS